MSHATPPAGPRYETRDARLTPLVKFTVFLTVFTAITLVAMYGFMRLLQRIPPLGDRPPHPLAALDNPIPPAPLLEAQRGPKQSWQGTVVDLKEPQPFTQHMWVDVKSEATQQLSTYGWVEKGKVVHVPIERAMELALQRGFPVSQKPKD
jgi:hypothetical protein